MMEEPLFDRAEDTSSLEVFQPHFNITVGTPHLPKGNGGGATHSMQRLLDEFIERQELDQYVLWYYTPMALSFSRHLDPVLVVYDCMDQLSAFADAPEALLTLERELLGRCDLLFTGGLSLYEAKRIGHPNAHCFPSSVDVTHFNQARSVTMDPDDQAGIPHPRLGYFGVIDERLDLDLIASVARACPSWSIVLVGPVTKLNPGSLPRAENIHYLGAKDYQALPAYIAGWDVAWLPFARNRATRFISPTKTPEYLAAGKPVVSTSIRDVVRTYGEGGYIRIADSVSDTIQSVRDSLLDNPIERLAKVDALLRGQSWDATWRLMQGLLSTTMAELPSRI